MARMLPADTIAQKIVDYFFIDLKKDKPSASIGRFETLMGIPVVDAVEVIRCRDCVSFYKGMCGHQRGCIRVE